MKLSYTDHINGFFSLTDVHEWINSNTSKPTITYKIILNLGSTIHFEVNLDSYVLNKNQIAFINPGSYISFQQNNNKDNFIIDFNSEFYCLDYHDKEISCNGLLFGAQEQIPLLHTNPEEKTIINRNNFV